MVRSRTEIKKDSELMRKLRMRAEQRLKANGKRDIAQMSSTEIAATIHELETHRIELEIQNEELRQTQNKLIEARDQYTELYDCAPTGYVTLTRTGRIVQSNLTFARMLGVPRDLLRNQPLSVYVASEDQDRYYTHRREAFETGERQSCELQLRPPHGGLLWVGLDSVTAESHSLDCETLRTVICDITDRKLAAGERDRFMAAVGKTAEMIVICDDKGIIEYVNPAFESITGYTFKDVVGQPVRILKSGEHDTDFYKDLWKTLVQGGIWTGRFINRKKDGTLYKEDAGIFPVLNDSGQTVNYVAVKRDVTEEVKMEESLRQAQKMQSLGLLVGRVARDFNNLLQIINGYADIARANMEPKHIVFGSIDEIAKAGGIAKELVQQLLSFSRLQKIDPVHIDLNELIEESRNMLGTLIGEKIKFRIIAEGEKVIVFSDRGQMQQVLINLCANARDAMPDGGTLTLKAENVMIRPEDLKVQAWARPGGYALLSVSDTGCGIDANIREQIFDPFFTTKKTGQGTGLGLFTVDGIVKQNVGHIELCSEPTKGTTIKIYLPGSIVP